MLLVALVRCALVRTGAPRKLLELHTSWPSSLSRSASLMLACWRVIGQSVCYYSLLARLSWETRQGWLRMLVCHTAIYREAIFTVRVASVVATMLMKILKERLFITRRGWKFWTRVFKKITPPLSRCAKNCNSTLQPACRYWGQCLNTFSTVVEDIKMTLYK